MTVGARLHRARRGHLRELAPVGRRGRGAPLRLLERARAAAAGVLRVGRGALPGAPVRAHPDRGRRSDRPLDPARIGWPSLQEAVTAARRAPAARGRPSSLGLLSVAVLPAAIAATRWSEEYELLARGGRDSRRAAARRARRSRSPAARAPGSGRRSAARGARERPASGACSGSCGLLLALTAAGSVGVYALLSLVAD